VTLVQASFHLAARQKQWLPQTATLEQAARQVIHALRRDVLFLFSSLVGWRLNVFASGVGAR
jgi:hypothetical protein